MPLNFNDDGTPNEAFLRGTPYVETPPTNTPRATPEEIKRRRDEAKRGNGTFQYTNSQGQLVTLTGEEFRQSTDPRVVAARNEMLSRPTAVSDPNLLFGGKEGRTLSPEEKDYRQRHRDFMEPIPRLSDPVGGPLGMIGLMVALAAGGAAAAGGLGGGSGAAAAPAAAGGGGAAAAPAVGAGGASVAAPTAAAGGAAATAPAGGAAASGGIGAGFGSNPGSLGIFANQGAGGMSTVGTGSMGNLVSSMSSGSGWGSAIQQGLKFLNNAQQNQPQQQNPQFMTSPMQQQLRALEENPALALYAQLMNRAPTPKSPGVVF